MDITQDKGGADPREGGFTCDPVTLPEMLTCTAARFPKKTALLFMGKKISFGELDRQVGSFALSLLTLGVRKGHRVATLLPNMPQMVIAAYGAMRIGAVVVPLDPLGEEEDLRRQLSDTGAETLVALDLRLPRCQALRKKTPLRRVIVCHITDYLPFPGNRLIPLVHRELYLKAPAEEGISEFLPLLDGRRGERAANNAAWEEEAAVFFPPGGGGRGVVLTHGNLSANVQQLRAWAAPLADGEESVLGVFPFFQAAGWTGVQNLAVLAGWTNILVPRPDPAVIVEIMQKARPTILPAPPAVLEGLVRHPAFGRLNLASLKAFLTGGEPLPQGLVEEIRKIRDCPVHVGYGLTEASPLAALTPWGEKYRPGTAGRALPGTKIKIADPQTKEPLPLGRSGEICLKGPQVMKGYLGSPLETAAALKEGWLHTKDRGFLDEGGYLFVVEKEAGPAPLPAQE